MMTDLLGIAAELKKSPGNRSMTPADIGRKLAESAARQGVLAVTSAVQLRDQGTVKQFIRLLDLPADLQSKVAWNRSNGTLPFTVASEIARVACPVQVRLLWDKAVTGKMTKKDVRVAVRSYS